MGLLDDVLNTVGGQQPQGQQQTQQDQVAGSPLQGALLSLLGGEGQVGGLGGLLQRFEQAGLGEVARSWVSNGPNQPVSPQQVGQALGPEQVQSLATQTGMPTESLLAVLAQHLPGIIDRLTANGQAPKASPAGPGGGFKV